MTRWLIHRPGQPLIASVDLNKVAVAQVKMVAELSDDLGR
jgi:hypothetical protein